MRGFRMDIKELNPYSFRTCPEVRGRSLKKPEGFYWEKNKEELTA